MLFSILKITIAISMLHSIESKPATDFKCIPSKLGCLCQDRESVTEKEIEFCCNKASETLIITGLLVRNISIDITQSKCANNFKNLIIRETRLVKFYSPFKGLNNIIDVNIERNANLSDFHRLVFEEINPNIVNIFVELNSFRTITNKTFANLGVLNTLRLSDNKIGYIEDLSFFGLKNLSALYMNNNILTLLKCEMFFGLESLTVLSLYNNPLQEPKSSDLFKYLKSLRHLMMSHGTNVELPGISQLPTNLFFNVKQLKTLNMTSIRIRNLTSLTFYGLNELERLDLQGNKLTVIPSGVFQQVPKITSINLARNQLYCLLSDTFHSLPKLANLDLSQNELSYISEDVFRGLFRLQSLDLAENNIYIIDRNAFVGLQSLMIIKLNIIHGRAKNEIQTKFASSSLAKLRNSTKIVGLEEYFGVSQGMNQAPELYTNRSRKKSADRMIMCPVASLSDKDWVDVNATGPRKYLLIIVGICVVFLLIAFAIIMTYRAWSKRRMGEIEAVEIKHDDEKQEMLQQSNNSNGRGADKQQNVSSKSSNHHHHHSHNNRKSINEQIESNAVPTTTVAVSGTVRTHIDDESALTPLGVL